MPRRLSNDRRKASKNHYCDMCGSVIRKGEYYWDEAYVFDDVYNWKQCDHCLPHVEKAMEMGYGRDYGGLNMNDFYNYIYYEGVEFEKRTDGDE